MKKKEVARWRAKVVAAVREREWEAEETEIEMVGNKKRKRDGIPENEDWDWDRQIAEYQRMVDLVAEIRGNDVVCQDARERDDGGESKDEMEEAVYMKRKWVRFAAEEDDESTEVGEMEVETDGEDIEEEIAEDMEEDLAED